MDDSYVRQLKRGTLEMIFLSLIADKPLYGGEIMSIINREGGPYFAGAREGSVYPVFYRLEDAGLIKVVPNGKQKKDYHITDKGIKKLADMTDVWNQFTDSVNFFLSRKEA